MKYCIRIRLAKNYTTMNLYMRILFLLFRVAYSIFSCWRFSSFSFQLIEFNLFSKVL